MRSGVFSFLCGALLLAQDAAAQDSFSSPKWVLRRQSGSDYACKCYPGDACWPDDAKWRKLNTTVGGNLRVNIPPGAPCYNSFQGPLGTVNTYNAAECEKVTANWNNEQFQYVSWYLPGATACTANTLAAESSSPPLVSGPTSPMIPAGRPQIPLTPALSATTRCW